MPCIERSVARAILRRFWSPNLTDIASSPGFWVEAASQYIATPRCDRHMRRSLHGRMYSLVLIPSHAGSTTPFGRPGKLGPRCVNAVRASAMTSCNSRSIPSLNTLCDTIGTDPNSWTVTRSIHREMHSRCLCAYAPLANAPRPPANGRPVVVPPSMPRRLAARRLAAAPAPAFVPSSCLGPAFGGTAPAPGAAFALGVAASSPSESSSESSTFIAVTAAEMGVALISPRISPCESPPTIRAIKPLRSMRLTPGHGSVFGYSTRSL
mmetsp:Transcript_11365/g.52782  ORF Transcript_11365/g.52782 Transcript_11365/m.52782 type:complete len:266 (-) Transcript_11365:1265-2062(-)